MFQIRPTLALSLLFIWLVGLSSPLAIAFTIPSPSAPIVDTALMISDDLETTLNIQLQEEQKKTGIEVAVVTIPSLNDELSIEEAAEKIFNTWKIGDAKKDNGALLLISKNDRKFRIEAGYGSEGSLTDLKSKQILDGMVHFFKAQDYDKGVQYAVGEILFTLTNDPTLRIEKTDALNQSGSLIGQIFEAIFAIIGFLFSGGIVPLIWISGVFSKSKSWYLGGIVGAGIGGLGLALGFSWIFIFLFGILGLLWDYIVSKEYKKHGSDSAWWAGSDLFSGSSSSSSSSSDNDSWGGFSGGSSGGGGASGGW